LEQPPDWRHALLALVLVVAMTQAGIGHASLLRAMLAPVRYEPASAALSRGLLPENERISPMVLAGVFLGSMLLGLAGALVARRRQWLWGLVGLCAGIALEFAWARLYYPYGVPRPSRLRAGLTITWRLHLSAHSLPLLAGALVCAAMGGTLATTRLRRWSVGIVTVCVAVSAIGAVWNTDLLLAFAAGYPQGSSGLTLLAYTLVKNAPYLAAGVWVGWVMRRWGLAWGAVVGLLPLYNWATRWSVWGPFARLLRSVEMPLQFVQHARSEGILDALCLFGSMVDYRALAAVVGGLLGSCLWQWKAARERPGVAETAERPVTAQGGDDAVCGCQPPVKPP
jgi:hypothetical protein